MKLVGFSGVSRRKSNTALNSICCYGKISRVHSKWTFPSVSVTKGGGIDFYACCELVWPCRTILLVFVYDRNGKCLTSLSRVVGAIFGVWQAAGGDFGNEIRSSL